ncbi:(deoxy)nucleoside triphosphate pyrophosphohydrolase [Thermodesulforhabdus norvegica]|uniref:8-oxo-dGTP diphosphatase n=1 Tax=Thermodesulforhabdus norvegica TaxID=39841 RepID=A0A1I4TS40_9BACT|nr:(deoxy)nucleoside triphosphate pyrophosphohydrolase [Thermodesulforhabdus norvegica]SFM79461.1 8-oxo-dGTP diphosphatase [Thermodesulforhabdus norvegica]
MVKQRTDRDNRIVGVTAAVIVRDGKILIARRKPGKKRAGFWEFPGGKIRDGESPEECLRRELLEELNIQVAVKTFLGSFVHSYPDITVELKAYLCTWTDGEITFRDHDSIKWVNPKKIARFRLSPADIPIADRILTLLEENFEDDNHENRNG